MRRQSLAPLAGILLLLPSCERAGPPDPPEVSPQTGAAVGADPAPSPSAIGPVDPRPVDPPQALVAEALVLAEWKRAENRGSCAPLAFAETAGARGAPRRAQFSGGWAVAFDLPNLRSAYGLAGTSVIGSSDGPTDDERAALAAQWPYFREIERLPQPAFAGYGVEGAAPYPADNPSGRGLSSLAYLRIGGQGCLYNVWSRLGRAHLEALLDELRVVRPE